MKFLFASGFQHVPQAYGGLMSNTHEIALELLQRGHEVAVAANMLPNDLLGFRTRLMGKFIAKKKVHDRFLGYPTYRRWNIVDAIPDLVDVIRPDVAIVQASHQMATARALDRLSVPMVVYFHDVEFDLLDGDPRDLRQVQYLSNSNFTARKYLERFGISSNVMPPLFRADDYRTARVPENVTFINPKPVKGSELAYALVAQCPEIPFNFVESRKLLDPEREFLDRFMEAHPNLSFTPRTKNMKRVYGKAKIVLAPSKWEEAWGRIASEAHFSGIPVLASNRGGLPESVGPGGPVLDADGPVENWALALRKLWNDECCYSEMSAAALDYSRRAEINPDFQIASFLEVAEKAIRQQNMPRTVTS